MKLTDGLLVPVRVLLFFPSTDLIRFSCVARSLPLCLIVCLTSYVSRVRSHVHRHLHHCDNQQTYVGSVASSLLIDAEMPDVSYVHGVLFLHYSIVSSLSLHCAKYSV